MLHMEASLRIITAVAEGLLAKVEDANFRVTLILCRTLEEDVWDVGLVIRATPVQAFLAQGVHAQLLGLITGPARSLESISPATFHCPHPL